MDEKPVYLDNAATTRIDPCVLEAMMPYLQDSYGNAASQYYSLGRNSLAAVEQARGQVAHMLKCNPGEIYFTSGATESDNWILYSTALWGGKNRHIVTSAIEHHAILEPLERLKKALGIEYTLVPVDKTGLVDPESLRSAIRPDTGLVSVIYANNEIGTVQPIRELAAVAHEKGVLFHTDICQAAGKIELDLGGLGVDMASLSAHKFHGPKGIGALFVKKGTRIEAFIMGGGQENRRRAGTTNVAGVVGLGKAADLSEGYIADGPRQFALVEKLWTKLSAEITRIRRNGNPEKRIPNLLSICVEGAEGEAILGYTDMYGIQVSSGSACTSGSLEPSHVLLACGVPVEIAHGSIRISLSHETKAEDIERVQSALPDAVKRLRQMSPTWKE